MIHHFPELEKRGATWKIWVSSLSDTDAETNLAEIHTQFTRTPGGKSTFSCVSVTSGKQKRSVWQQAIFIANSKWNAKYEKEMYNHASPTTSSEDDNTFDIISKFRPMLATTYDSHKQYPFPLILQPKIDGLRCFLFLDFDKHELRLFTRQGKPFPFIPNISDNQNLIDILQHLPRETILDGELYDPSIPFETLNGILRSKTHHLNQPNLKYIIFDTFSYHSVSSSTQSRLSLLKQHFPGYTLDLDIPFEQHHSPFLICPDFLVSDQTLFDQLHSFFLQKNYEGTIIRFPSSQYAVAKRSKYLVKRKEMIDSEFEIVGFEQGVGSMSGCVIWICSLPHDSSKTFRVVPRGTQTQRQDWFQNASSFIGKKLTVIYQELSPDGIPRFPVGKSIRLDL